MINKDQINFGALFYEEMANKMAPTLHEWKKMFGLFSFMVFKSIGLDSWFQHKNQYFEIWTESQEMVQNVSKFSGLVWKVNFGELFH